MLRLIGLAHAGGSAPAFALLRQHLPAALEFRVHELPGHGSRQTESLFTDRAALVPKLCAEFSLDAVTPYAFFGHGLGATLAFELSHALIAQGLRAPSMLFAAASAAPSCAPVPRSPSTLTDTALVAELRLRGLLPDSDVQETQEPAQTVQSLVQILRADLALRSTAAQRGMAPLPCPIHVFAARGDELTLDALMPWRRETRGEFSLRWFEGDHFFVRGHAAPIATTIVRHLTEASLMAPSSFAHA